MWGLLGTVRNLNMADKERDSLNAFFQELTDWETVLQGLDSDILSEVPEPET